MRQRGYSLFLAIAVLGAGMADQGPARAAEAQHATAELIAERSGLGPGRNWVALRLVPEPGWHVYWINPGDSGLATSIAWSLPPGVVAGKIEWPAPHAFQFGSQISYGYSEEVLHLVPIEMPAGWSGGGKVPLKADVRWLVCADVCIPGKASLALELPFTASPAADGRWREPFVRARAQLPREPKSWRSLFAIEGGKLALTVAGELGKADQAEFFPESNELVDHSAPQKVAFVDGGLRIEQKLSPYFTKSPSEVSGVLVLRQGASSRAWRIRAQP